MINSFTKILAAGSLTLSVISTEATADEIELTCDVFFVGDEGPDHIFEFYLDLEAPSNSFKYHGHSYELDYTYSAPEMDVSSSKVLLTAFPDNNRIENIEIYRYDLSVWIELKQGEGVGGLGPCQIGVKKPGF